MFGIGERFDIESVVRSAHGMRSAVEFAAATITISGVAVTGLWVPLLIGGAAGAAAVLGYQAYLRRHKDPDGGKPELILEPEDPRIIRALAYRGNDEATRVLQGTLVNLMDEKDWGRVNRQLNEAVKKWCKRQRVGRRMEKLEPKDLHGVFLDLIRDFKEATYRELFDEHYRQLVSVDPRVHSRVGDVFIRLQAQYQKPVSGEEEAPKSLDFRGKTSTEIAATLRQSNNLVILGEPGSGKSTLLRYLAASCTQSESPTNRMLPVFLPLRDYAGGKDVLISQSAAAFAEGDLQLKMHKGFFDAALESDDGCLVCLDALDEVPAAERSRILNAVAVMAGRYPKSRFIVTSRLAGYDAGTLDEKIFAHYVAEPMDDDNIGRFITWLCDNDQEMFDNDKELAQERARNLRHVALNANPGIKSLVSNPLHMAMFNKVYRDDDQEGLPFKRAEFYKKAVEKLIKDEDSPVDDAARLRPFYKPSVLV